MPYPNEHAARLRNPDDFDPKSFRRTHGSGDGRVQGVKIPETIDVIWGKLKDANKPSDPVIAQALRFPIKNWTEAEARNWLKKNEIKYDRKGYTDNRSIECSINTCQKASYAILHCLC
jgi:3'-phosphoadenosine 5'-phosphosulfate sulfotransferase (PAPS reductase)/FAD synthetase